MTILGSSLSRNGFNSTKRTNGAYYTPEKYVELSTAMLRNAIKNIPAGNDYIILDRSAGSGNLESQFTDDELSHCILNTLFSEEQAELAKAFGGKVRMICDASDALAEEFIDNPKIKKFVDDPNCNVILLENPPFVGTSPIESQKAHEIISWGGSYVVEEMKKKNLPCKDIVNAFIWSGFNYYLKKPNDYYIVYAPIKYWKKDKLVNKRAYEAYLLNRKRFTAPTDAAISLIRWGNEEFSGNQVLLFDLVDIKKGKLDSISNYCFCHQIDKSFVKEFYPKENKNSLYPCTDYSGILLSNTSKKVSNDAIGYIVANSTEFNNPRLHCVLTSLPLIHGGGFSITKNNYLKYLPVFCAAAYGDLHSKFYETGYMMKSGDGAEKYFKDVATGKLDSFLRDCLVFTCMTTRNHCHYHDILVDNKVVQIPNELTFDTRAGESLAYKEIRPYINNYKKLFDLYNDIIKSCTYLNTYNISTYFIKMSDTTKETKDKLKELKEKLTIFYDNKILPILKSYSFIV